MEPIVLESCHSTWLLDLEAMRFRRVLKGVEVDGHPVSTEWRPFFGVEFDEASEGFTVMLNSEHTKLLRSWRHTHRCAQCGGHVTTELSLDDLQTALR
jgi:hypothetical protein